MAHRLRTAALVLAATTATAVVAAPAHAGAPPGGPVTVVAQGLDDPFGLASEGGKFYVAESSTGEISGFVPGGQPTVRVAGFAAPAGVDRRAGTLYVVTGEARDPAATGGSTLWTSRRDEPRRVLADLLAFELADNPDGQPQFGPDGAPLDALSNPFAVLAGQGSDRRVFVADAGANDVLAVDPDGTVSAFFVPPAVTTGPCEGVENNGVADGGCDPVPTGLAWGPDGHLFVSTLSGEAPGEGRVYELDPCDGTVLRETSGFTAPTGVAVGDDGTLYVSELLEGAPAGEGPPPADFDPTTVGRIVAVAPDGERSAAQVTMPLGLRFTHGHLYSTAFSVGGLFLGQPGLGQVVRVDDAAFAPLD